MSTWTENPTVHSEAAVLSAVLPIFPNASFGQDFDGQLVIYTDCVFAGDHGELVMGEINLPLDSDEQEG